MLQFPAEELARWAASQPEILGLYIFGSRARGDARPDSDLDVAFKLDSTRESELTVLIGNASRWKRELRKLTGFKVKDLYLESDELIVNGCIIEVFRRRRRRSAKRKE